MKKRLLLLLLLVSPLWGREQSPLLSVGGGIARPAYPKAYAQIEIKGTFPSTYIRPQVGMATFRHHSVYLYGGLALDIFPKKTLVFTPSFSPGLYLKGKGKDLGCKLEFRSAAELALVSRKGYRIGSQYMHLSNASIAKKNPGVNAVVLFGSLPL